MELPLEEAGRLPPPAPARRKAEALVDRHAVEAAREEGTPSEAPVPLASAAEFLSDLVMGQSAETATPAGEELQVVEMSELQIEEIPTVDAEEIIEEAEPEAPAAPEPPAPVAPAAAARTSVAAPRVDSSGAATPAAPVAATVPVPAPPPAARKSSLPPPAAAPRVPVPATPAVAPSAAVEPPAAPWLTPAPAGPPEPAPAPLEPPPSFVTGTHRVVVHTVEGQVLRGTLSEAELDAPDVPLAQADGSTSPIPASRVKAIFFMLPQGGRPPVPEGRRVRVTFADGRQVAGFSPDYRPGGPGFFMVPADTRTNTGRIWVYRSSLRDIVVS